jgi:Domain of unknown function (DUF4115)
VGSGKKSAVKLAIRLVVVQDCFVEMTVTATGQLIYQGAVSSGNTKTWIEHQPVTMVLGNPAGVELTVNGQNPIPPGSVTPVTVSLPS